MPRQRSRKGCPECRRRRIKCDESQPKCGQCRKSKLACHLQDSVFKHTFVSGETTSPKTRSTTTTTDDDDNAPKDAPSGLSTLNFQTAPTPGTDISSCSGPQVLSPHAASVASPMERVSSEPTIESLKDSQLELFFLRHYSDCIAPWMDLLYQYEVFSREVLILARTHPILRYAACAVAAKQLGQLRKPFSTLVKGEVQHRIAREIANGKWGFTWYGIKYYEKAIRTLFLSIEPKTTGTPVIPLDNGELFIQADLEDPIVRLLGTCIMIQYEHLTANREAWSGHLTGFAKLLDLIDEGRLLVESPLYEQVYPWTKDIMEIKAGFWNFVVNDMEESFVAHRKTRIDTENIELWRNMGLVIDDDGSMSLVSGPHSLSSAPEHVQDKVLTYFVIRLLCKLVDCLADEKEKQDLQNMEHQFETWFQLLSISFHPDGTFTSSKQTPSSLFATELWFSNDRCATTMMYYHMGRALLIFNRMPDRLEQSTNVVHMLRSIDRQLQSHAAAIIATARGTPCDAVRLRAIQPLYVAGCCCDSRQDKELIVEMLQDIEHSLGIATTYRVDTLLKKWGATRADFGLDMMRDDTTMGRYLGH